MMWHGDEPPANLEAEVAELFKLKMQEFAAWAAENWTMTLAEAETLTEPTDAPEAYARGYSDGITAIPDALHVWLEGIGYT